MVLSFQSPQFPSSTGAGVMKYAYTRGPGLTGIPVEVTVAGEPVGVIVAVRVAVTVGVAVGPSGVVVTVGWVVCDGPWVGAKRAVRVRSGVGPCGGVCGAKDPHPDRIKLVKAIHRIENLNFFILTSEQ